MPDMRFSPQAALRFADRGGGLNQTSVRAYNERLVMSLLRRHGGLSRASIGKMTGLSLQTVSVITAALEQDGLIAAEALLRGKVGPPTRLLTLNPQGAYAVGVNIGTRSTDVVLVDFLGEPLHHLETGYDFPDTEQVVAHLGRSVPSAIEQLAEDERGRVVGMGVSLPEDIASWPLPEWGSSLPGAWSEIDLESRLEEVSGLTVYLQDDVTAAAASEILFGDMNLPGDFIYVFISDETPIRLVLNHHIYAGRRGPGGARSNRRVTSLSDLDKALAETGEDATLVWTHAEAWPEYGQPLRDWIDMCSDSVTEAIEMVSASVDVKTVIIDGRIPPDIREQICEAVAERTKGDEMPQIRAGSIGALAKSVGAASMPFYSRFMVEDVGLTAQS